MAGPQWKAIRSTSYSYVGALAFLFATTRLSAILFPNPASDVLIYAEYAQEFAEAGRAHLSFYDYHVRKIERQIEEIRATGRRPELLEEYKYVEYPPLALAVMRLPQLWMERKEEPGAPSPDFRTRYYRAFRLGMAYVDIALFVLLFLLGRRLFPFESVSEHGERLLIYLGATLFLWHLLYDRLDLVLAAMMLGAFALLVSKRHYFWSFAALAVAVNFKIIPIVLAPVWVIGSMPVNHARCLARRRLWTALAGRLFVLLFLTASIFLPFYWLYGSRSLDFVIYHRSRGLEIGSLYSSLQILLKPWARPLGVTYSYGSINLNSELAPALLAIAPYLAILALLAGTVVLVLRASSLAGFAADAPCRSLAQRFPPVFADYALLFLMLFIATNKVFSPQYLLWLVPFVALLSFPRGKRRPFQVGFLSVCLLTTAFFPFLFSDLVVPVHGLRAPYWIFHEPSWRVTIVAGVRNLFFAVLTVWLAINFLQRLRQPVEESNPEAPHRG